DSFSHDITAYRASWREGAGLEGIASVFALLRTSAGIARPIDHRAGRHDQSGGEKVDRSAHPSGKSGPGLPVERDHNAGQKAEAQQQPDAVGPGPAAPSLSRYFGRA